MKVLARYRNGNYMVKLYSDGTKIKSTDADFFDAGFPDSMDIKITNYCDMNCAMCHEMSTVNGLHGDLNQPFLDTLHFGTELAIGGGNPLSHPQLVDFLSKLTAKGIIPNVTVNEKHLLSNIDFVQELIDIKLIYGLGVSLNEQNPKTLEFAKKNDNVVLHLIIGIVTLKQLENLYDKGYKILLLGYKKFGRGATYYNSEVDKNIEIIERNIQTIFNSFKVVSFDNLALEQLKIQEKVAPKVYDTCFMGDDGESTMYVDLVEKQFALSSTSFIRYPIENDIKTMFEKVKKTH